MSHVMLTCLRLMLSRCAPTRQRCMKLVRLVLAAPVAARQLAEPRWLWTPELPTPLPHRWHAQPAHATITESRADQPVMGMEQACEESDPPHTAQGSRRSHAEHEQEGVGAGRTGALRSSRTAPSTGAWAAHCALAPSSAASARESAAVSCKQRVHVTSAGTTSCMWCTAGRRGHWLCRQQTVLHRRQVLKGPTVMWHRHEVP